MTTTPSPLPSRPLLAREPVDLRLHLGDAPTDTARLNRASPAVRHLEPELAVVARGLLLLTRCPHANPCAMSPPSRDRDAEPRTKNP